MNGHGYFVKGLGVTAAVVDVGQRGVAGQHFAILDNAEFAMPRLAEFVLLAENEVLRGVADNAFTLQVKGELPARDFRPTISRVGQKRHLLDDLVHRLLV